MSGPAEGLSEYLLDTTDLIHNGSLEYDRLLPNAKLTLAARTQDETLSAPADFGAGAPTQAQNNHTFLARYQWNGGAHLEYTAVAYESSFSTFGTSFNPRAAVVWRPTSQTVVRASLGTGFQAPLLAEKVVPAPLPPPDANGLINVGNPNLTADHTTEYEVDAEHAFGPGPSATSAELDLYHVSQRGDDLQFIPAGASPASPKLSYPVNIADSVWQGAAMHLVVPLPRGLALQAAYDINAAYPLALPADLLGSSGNIVPFQQYQSVPLQRGTFSLQQQNGKVSWRVALAYEAANNDLSQGPFAACNADVTYSLEHTSLTLAGYNLTGVYAGRFTLAGAGIPYPGLQGPIPTDAYSLQAPSLLVTVTQHW